MFIYEHLYTYMYIVPSFRHFLFLRIPPSLSLSQLMRCLQCMRRAVWSCGGSWLTQRSMELPLPFTCWHSTISAWSSISSFLSKYDCILTLYTYMYLYTCIYIVHELSRWLLLNMYIHGILLLHNWFFVYFVGCCGTHFSLSKAYSWW